MCRFVCEATRRSVESTTNQVGVGASYNDTLAAQAVQARRVGGEHGHEPLHGDGLVDDQFGVSPRKLSRATPSKLYEASLRELDERFGRAQVSADHGGRSLAVTEGAERTHASTVDLLPGQPYQDAAAMPSIIGVPRMLSGSRGRNIPPVAERDSSPSSSNIWPRRIVWVTAPGNVLPS